MLDSRAMRREAELVRKGVLALAGLLAASTAGAQEPAWHFGPGAKLTRPGVELQVAGYVQEDFRSFHDYEDAQGRLPVLGETIVLRRVRLGFDAHWNRVRFQVDVDPHDSAEHLKNLIAEIRISKGLRLAGGNMKLPVSPDWLASAAKTDFVERNLASQTLSPGRDWGVRLSGDPRPRLAYQAGVFAGDGRTDQGRAKTTVAGRLEFIPRMGLELGASASQGNVRALPIEDGMSPAARGFSIRAPSGFRVYERHFVDGPRRRLGADAHYHHQSVGLRLEVLQLTEARKGQGSLLDDLPNEVGRGWALSATWLVTGERKARTIKPNHPIDHHGIGAVELGVRCDAINVDDAAGDSGLAGAGSRARNIRPVGTKTLTGGVSWWPVEFIRFYGNAVLERYDDALLAPVPGRKGNYVTLLGRLQVAVP